MTTGTHGILNPRAGDGVFTLDRRVPPRDLEPFVERYWIVRWQLRGRAPFAQETLPHPNVNLVIGTHRPGVHGVGTKRFVAELEGEGPPIPRSREPASSQRASPSRRARWSACSGGTSASVQSGSSVASGCTKPASG